jgi:DNA polymerase III sliding clamp (beta) subunit (PCNA family)
MTSVFESPVAVDDVAAEGVSVPVTNAMKAKALHTAVSDALLFAAPPSARLPFLEAVRLEFGGGRLVAVATDRFVLGASRVEYSGEPFIVMMAGDDARALVKMAKTVKRDEAARAVAVEVVDAGAQVTFRFSTGESMTVRGLDVQFPKWRQPAAVG